MEQRVPRHSGVIEIQIPFPNRGGNTWLSSVYDLED